MALRDLIITPAQRIIFAAARAKARRAAKLDLERQKLDLARSTYNGGEWDVDAFARRALGCCRRQEP